MEQKNFQLIVSVMCFIIGGLFVMSNSQDINANVIGASGPEAGLVSVFGIIILIASGAYFIFTVSLDDRIKTERAVRPSSSHHMASDHVAEEYTETGEEKYEKKD